MSRHHVLCVAHAETHGHHGHHHIIDIGTGTVAGGITRRWTLPQVLDAIDQREEFYTQGETSGKQATVEAYHCHVCHGRHIRTKPDEVVDNNLDHLKKCPLRKDIDDRPPQPNRHHA